MASIGLAGVRKVNVASGEPVGLSNTTPATGTGGSGNGPIPLASQGLVRWLTGVFVDGRELRGRLFIPGVQGARTENGRPTSTFLSNVAGFVNEFLSNYESSFVIYSRAHRQMENVPAASIWGQWAILRRRRD